VASKGYVLNGVYHRAQQVPMNKLVRTQQTMYKQGDHARQRFDHSAEILQPYDYKGNPNQQFIEAYPEAAAEYGFLPKAELGQPLASDTPQPGQPGYGNSRPWGS
jgi:hypothetical protein